MENQQSFEQPPTAVNVTVPKRKRHRPREYLTEREIEKLIKAAGSNRWGHRDATAILIAYRHGLRASELVALRWDDIIAGPSAVSPDGVGSRCAIKTSTLCPLIEVNRPLLLQCGNACF